MSADAVVYLEADDEVTSVVRRLRAADAPRVILVAPGRSRAVSSVVALRLLARAGDSAGRGIAVVGDALTRSLAAEAGIEAYATLEDARRSVRDPAAPEPHRATISIVRGGPAMETAPTLAAGPVGEQAAADATSDTPPPAADPDADLTVVAPRIESTRADDLTRPVRVSAPAVPFDGDVAGRRTSAPGSLPGIAVLALVALVGATAAAGAVLLPAATVTIRPASLPVGPATYAIEDAPAERRSGTVEATAVVTATGTYSMLEPAVGTVVLFNWTSAPVRVPAGTFVAAGEQAFATQAEVVVPSGSLTADGRIAAGDVAVAVVAAAAGPAANVPAEAIDTVVNDAIDAQLRGFANNPERRVTNPEPTAGGLDTSGPEIVQADVDAAVADLREQLAEATAAALPDGDVVARPAEPAEPVIQALDSLVGTRDQPETELVGTQEWEAWIVDADAVEAEAIDRFASDPGVLPVGHELVADGVDLAVAGTSVKDGRVTVDVRVAGRAVAAVDRAAALDAVRGRSADAAEAVLAPLGEVDVRLWPFWASTVPSLDWRITVEIEDVGGPSAEPTSGSDAASGAPEGSAP